MPNRIALFQKTRAFNKFSWERKRRVNKFFYCKRIWKIQEKLKLKFRFINLLVKRRNSPIFYIINIMNFSKFSQEIYFYLLNQRFSFIHSFQADSHALMNDFKSRKYNEKLHFQI